MKSVLLLAAAACATPLGAQELPSHRVGATFERNELDSGYADWRERALHYGYQWHKRGTAELNIRETRRFGLEDTEIYGGATLPASERLTLDVRGSFSDTARVLPRHNLTATAQYEFLPAWLLYGTLRHTRYRATDVNQATVMLEHYFGNWSAAAAAHHARALGERTRAVELRAAYYYAEKSSIGVIASSGDEATQVGEGQVALARTRSVALVGKHAIDRSWTLHYSLLRSRQGDFYRRNGASIGVHYAF